MIALAIGAIGCTAWLFLLTARGGFWLARPLDATLAMEADDSWPRVVAVVPARDEAEGIGGCVASLCAQDYRGSFSIVVVDDNSTDATAANARAAALASNASERLTVLPAPPPPQGWTGKLAALRHGIAQAQGFRQVADYWLLTDADIVHAADTLTQLVSRARRDGLVLVSLMAKLRCANAVERAFVPAFVLFFAMLYPFAWVNRRDRRTAAAAGGCMLVRRDALERAGGLEAVRDALIDDCALARLLKAQGPIWLGLTERVRSARVYASVAEIRSMIVRSAYAQLRFSPLILVATVLAMALTYVAPPLLTAFANGPARLLGALAWLQMTLAFQPTLRFYRVSWLSGVALPAIACAYLVFTIDSALQAARGKAGLWKGRVYPTRASRGDDA